MVRNSLWTVTLGALITIGYLAPASAAPIAPSAGIAPISSYTHSVSFWGVPFPFGYAYFPGQCYKYVEEETPEGLRLRRVWICTEPGGRGYGGGGRF